MNTVYAAIFVIYLYSLLVFLPLHVSAIRPSTGGICNLFSKTAELYNGSIVFLDLFYLSCYALFCYSSFLILVIITFILHGKILPLSNLVKTYII
jgi:hypothetical protein